MMTIIARIRKLYIALCFRRPQTTQINTQGSWFGSKASNVSADTRPKPLVQTNNVENGASKVRLTILIF